MDDHQLPKCSEPPGGKVYINQQPEDSLQRALETHIGLQASTIHLDDALTYIDPDDRELQYAFIVSPSGAERDRSCNCTEL